MSPLLHQNKLDRGYLLVRRNGVLWGVSNGAVEGLSRNGACYRLAVGGAAAEVVARAAGADLVVVGTHGRGGLERLLVGSVAGEIVRSAPCSVLVVPAAAACELAPTRHAAEAGEPDWLFHFG